MTYDHTWNPINSLFPLIEKSVLEETPKMMFSHFGIWGGDNPPQMTYDHTWNPINSLFPLIEKSVPYLVTLSTFWINGNR